MATSLSVGLVLYDLLNSSAELTAKVNKIYPVVSPDEANLPYVVYRVVSSDCRPNKTLVSSDDVNVEVTVWASSYTESVEIAEIVRKELDYKHGESSGLHVRSMYFIGQGAEDYQDDAYYKILNFNVKL